MKRLRDFTILPIFDDICVYRTGDVPPWSNTEAFYPQCVTTVLINLVRLTWKSLKTMCNLYCAFVFVHSLLYTSCNYSLGRAWASPT